MNVTARSSRRWRLAQAVSVVAIALTWPPAPSSASGSEIPEPEKGRWAETAVALLHYSHDQCSGVGHRTLEYWRRISDHDVEAALDNYVLTRATADLTGARKALDIARAFLPRAVAEIDMVEGKVLDSLYEADTELCNVVAQPAPPRADYESRIEIAEGEVRAAEVKVAEVLGIDEAVEKELAKRLQPYLEAIELAAGVAREQVRQELEALKPPPELPTAQDEMELWHVGYEQAVLPAKSALRAYLQGRSQNDGAAIQTACKDLQDSVLPLLIDDDKRIIFQAPDKSVEKPLKAVYTTMRNIGILCSSGQFSRADDAYERLRDQLNRAATILAPYSLRP